MPRYIDAEQLEYDLDKYYEPEHEGVIHWIQVQRTANVAPIIHGKWEYDELSKEELEEFGNRSYYCSECGFRPYEPLNFCSNCGARIDR